MVINSVGDNILLLNNTDSLNTGNGSVHDVRSPNTEVGKGCIY